MRVIFAMIFILVPVLCQGVPLWSVQDDHVVMNKTILADVFAKSTTEFTLPVDGQIFQVKVEQISGPNLGITSLRGRIDGKQESFFLLCSTESGATGAFFQPGDGTAYQLSHKKDYDQVSAVEYEKLGSCGGGVKAEEFTRAPEPHYHPVIKPTLNRDKEGELADDGSRHDIIVGYTPAAMAHMGGLEYILIAAQLSVDSANLVYENSDIASRLRLVHVMETPYEETEHDSYNDYISNLYYPDDGFMDDMIVARNLVGADFVSVLVDGSDESGETPICGMAPMMCSDEVIWEFEAKAVSVISIQCAIVNWSFVHEIGHNRGCEHNRSSADFIPAYSFSYGYRFGTDDPEVPGYRTVMAYDHFYFSYERIPYFSNPSISYNGFPTGVWPPLENEAYNALTHDNTAALCSTFRGERTFIKFGNSGYDPTGMLDEPFISITGAISGSRDGGTIVFQNGSAYFTGTLPGDKRLYIHDGAGSAVLGDVD